MTELFIPTVPPILTENYTAEEAVASFQASFQWFFDALVRDRDGKGDRLQRTPEERAARRATSLRRFKSFLDFTGNPEQQFPAVHVAGTSGKGSTTLMIASIFSGSIRVRSGLNLPIV